MTNSPRRITDAAKKMSDIVNGQVVAQPFEVIIRSFMAFKMADGSSDGVLYGSRQTAIDHQLSPNECLYISMRSAPGGMMPLEAQTLLDYYRMQYDAGGRVATQSRGEMIIPLGREEVALHCAKFLQESGYTIDRYRKD